MVPAQMPQTPTAIDGREIAGRYRLGRILGEGGMGVVYEATHLMTQRQVALKLMRPEFADDRQTLLRFFTEARAATKLRHPNVIDVLDCGESEDGLPFIVLDYLDGETFEALMLRDGPLPPEVVLGTLRPVMDALAQGHDNGILHRDLKPGNVFLSLDHLGRMTPKLLDFGVAKFVGVVGAMPTETGTMVGTPAYMSPEQVRGQPDLDGRIDVWGMGILLYEALSARRPFEAENAMALVMQIATEPAPPLASVAPDVPAAVCEAVDRALRTDREDRWQDMHAFLAAIS